MAPSQDLTTLRDELIRRGVEDQRVRPANIEALPPNEHMALIHDMERVDADNTAFLKRVIERHGWPGRSLVGDDAARAAFLIVQHADADPDFQARCLPMLEEAAARGEVRPAHVAYLTDRVRVEQGRPQLYGTQYSARTTGGQFVVGPGGSVEYEVPLVEDAARLDERRAAAGLGPWIEYERQMAAMQNREPVDAPRDAGP